MRREHFSGKPPSESSSRERDRYLSLVHRPWVVRETRDQAESRETRRGYNPCYNRFPWSAQTRRGGGDCDNQRILMGNGKARAILAFILL